MKISPLIRAFVVVVFVLNTAGPLPARAQDLVLPRPGAMVSLSPAYNPPVLKGIKVYPDDAFRFDFIMDKGDGSAAQWKPEASKLIKYFLAGLTVPEKDLWVNLSPYEKNRIVPESFGRTAMGRDLLAEDYLLKQITASLIYPEGETGRKFWKRVYEVAAQKFHTTDIPVNTFNKVWIMPETAVVYENTKAGTAYVVEAKLKVMLEQDYLALSHHVSNAASTSSIGAQVLRAIVIPELTREVNDDKNFAALRQVYNSLILATWYKKKIKNSILEAVYADKNKVGGVGYGSGIDVESIYQRYLRAFKKGVYNYVKEETDPLTQETVPRKYFSGGETFIGVGSVIKTVDRLPAKDALADQAMIVRASFQSLPASQPEEELAGGIGDLMDNVVTPDGRPLTPISSGIAQDPDRLAAALIEKLNGVVLDKQRTAWALLHVTQKPFNGHVNGSPEIVIRFGPRETFYMTFVLNKNKITRVSVFAPKFGKLLYAVVGSVLPSGIQAEGDITEEKSAQELQQEYEVRGTDVYENGRLGRRVVDGPSQDHSIGMADVLAGTLIGTLNMKYMGLSYRDFIYDGEHGVRALWAYLSKGHNEDAFTLRFRKDAAQVALLESDFGRRMYFDPRHRSLLIDNKAAELIGVGGSNYIFNTFNHVAFRIYYNPHALPPGVRGGFETMANSSRGLKILGEGFTANGYYFLAVEQVQGDSLDHMADLNPKQWRDFKAMWRDLIDKMYFMDDPKPQQFMYGFTQRVRRDQWWVVDAELVQHRPDLTRNELIDSYIRKLNEHALLFPEDWKNMQIKNRLIKYLESLKRSTDRPRIDHAMSAQGIQEDTVKNIFNVVQDSYFGGYRYQATTQLFKDYRPVIQKYLPPAGGTVLDTAAADGKTSLLVAQMAQGIKVISSDVAAKVFYARQNDNWAVFTSHGERIYSTTDDLTANALLEQTFKNKQAMEVDLTDPMVRQFMDRHPGALERRNLDLDLPMPQQAQADLVLNLDMVMREDGDSVRRDRIVRHLGQLARDGGYVMVGRDGESWVVWQRNGEMLTLKDSSPDASFWLGVRKDISLRNGEISIRDKRKSAILAAIRQGHFRAVMEHRVELRLGRTITGYGFNQRMDLSHYDDFFSSNPQDIRELSRQEAVGLAAQQHVLIHYLYFENGPKESAAILYKPSKINGNGKANAAMVVEPFDDSTLTPEERREWEIQKGQWEAWSRKPIDHPRYPSWSKREIRLIPEVLKRLHDRGFYLRGGVIQNDKSPEGTAVVQSVLGLPRTPVSVWNKALQVYKDQGGYAGALKAAGLDPQEIAKEPGSAELRLRRQRDLQTDPTEKIAALEDEIKKQYPDKQLQEVSFGSLFEPNPYGFSLKTVEAGKLLTSGEIIKLKFQAPLDAHVLASELSSLEWWDGNTTKRFIYGDQTFTWGFLLAELIKNALVHGNHLDSQWPVYLHVQMDKDLLEVYDFALVNKDDTYKAVAERSSLSGHSKALGIIRNFKGMSYEYKRLSQGAMSKVSPAMTANANPRTTGGIDLRPGGMDLQTNNSGESIKFNLDPARLQELRQASGMVPVILDIRPLSNLKAFLDSR